MQKAVRGQRGIHTATWNTLVDRASPNVGDGSMTTIANVDIATKTNKYYPFEVSKITASRVKIRFGNITYKNFNVPLKDNDGAWFVNPEEFAVNPDLYKVLEIKTSKFNSDDELEEYELTHTETNPNGTRDLFVVVKIWNDETPILPFDSIYPFPSLYEDMPTNSCIYLTNSFELAGLGNNISGDEVLTDIANTCKAVAKISVYGNGDVEKIQELFYNDIQFSTGVASAPMLLPFDCDFIEVEEGDPLAFVKKVRVRNGGFYFKDGSNQYSFIGQGVDIDDDSDITVLDLKDYVFERFRNLDAPAEPVSADELKYIVWAGVDTTSINPDCFVEITTSVLKPDRESMSILVPIAELIWTETIVEEVSTWTLTMNQLKRGFIYEEVNIAMPFDTTLNVSIVEEEEVYTCKVRCGGFTYTGVSGEETFRGFNTDGDTVDYVDYVFNSFRSIVVTPLKPVICAILFKESTLPQYVQAKIVNLETDLEYIESGINVLAIHPIARLIIGDGGAYMHQLFRGFIPYNIDKNDMPFDCELTGLEVGGIPLNYEVTVRNGVFVFTDDNGDIVTVASGIGGFPSLSSTLADYDFYPYETILLSEAKPIAAAVLFREISTGYFGANVGAFNELLEVDGFVDELLYEVLEIIPLAKLLLEPVIDENPKAYIFQLAHGFQYVNPFGTGGSDATGMPFDCEVHSVEAPLSDPPPDPLPDPPVMIDKLRIRCGGFYVKEDLITYRFVGQTELATITATSSYDFNQYRYIDIPASGSHIIWAGVDTTSTTEDCFTVITANTTRPTMSTLVLMPIAEVKIVGTEVIINQLKRGFQFYNNEKSQLNHSWIPTRTSATTFSITNGWVNVGNSIARVRLPTNSNLQTTGLLIGTNYGIRVSWASNLRVPVVTWETYGTPGDVLNTAVQRFFPIIEFINGNTWSHLVRRTTSDIQTENYIMPVPPATAAILYWNGAALNWIAAGNNYRVLQQMGAGIGFDYVRVMQ